ISGTVSDPSGAVIPGVTILARNAETGLEQSTTTNDEGFYAFPALPIGHYEIVMGHPGFKPYRQAALTIDASTALRVDVRLELGPQTQTVNITEAGSSIETTNTQMGQIATGTKITSGPLNGRGFTDLLALQPGVIP